MSRLVIRSAEEAGTGCQERLFMLTFIIAHLMVVHEEMIEDHLVRGTKK